MIDKNSRANVFERVQSTKQYSLFVKNSIQVLQMRLEIRQKNYQVVIYEASLNKLSSYQRLKQFCDTFSDVTQYIKNADNISLNLNDKILTITQRSAINKCKLIDLAAIKFEYKQRNKIQISEVIAQKCSVRGQLCPDQIKNMFELLAFTLQEQIVNLNKNSIQKKQQSLITRKQMNQQLNKIRKQLYVTSEKQMSNGQSLQRQESLKYAILKINKQISALNEKLNQSNNKLFQTDIDVQVNEEIKKFKDSIVVDCISQAQKIISEKLQSQPKAKIFPRSIENQKFEKEMFYNTLSKSQSTAEIKISKQLPKSIWVDQTCCHFSRLLINNNTITLNKQDAHIFGQFRILKYPTFSVFIKRMEKIMGLGIIDIEYKSRGSMGSPPNALVYYKDGCYNGKQRKFHEGTGFKQGQTVTIVVEREKSRILWKVGECLRYQLENQSIKNDKIEWVPYIYLMDKDVVVIGD